MSGTIVSLIVLILANVLPKVGVPLGSDQLTSFVEVLVTIVTALVIWVRHIDLKKQTFGSTQVNIFGGLKRH